MRVSWSGLPGARASWFAVITLSCLLAFSPAQGQASRFSNLRKVLVVDKNWGGPQAYLDTRLNLNAAMQDLAAEHGFEAAFIRQTDNSSALSAASLAGFQVVVFNSNEALHNIVQDSLRPGFEAWVRNGGGVIALHMASAFLNWPFMQEALVESFYGPHGTNAPTATLLHDSEGLADDTEARGILRGLSAPAGFLDVFISFRASPRGRPGVTILVTVDEKTFSKHINGPMGEDHPVVWTKTLGRGRVVHNSLGFSWPASNAYAQSDGYLKKLLYNTLRYAAGDFVGCMDRGFEEYNPDATRSDPAACRLPATTALGGEVGTPPRARLSLGAGERLLRVGVRAGGAHAVTLFDLSGRLLESRTGAGPADYVMPMPGRSGIYIVVVEAGGRATRHRVALP